MKLKNLVFVAMFFLFAACSRDNGSSAPVGSTCGLDMGKVAAHLGEKVDVLLPGVYVFEAADYLDKVNGESVVTSSSITTGSESETHRAELLCPSSGNLSQAVANPTVIDNEVPSSLSVNPEGLIELPNTFNVRTLRLQATGNKLSIESPEVRQSSLSGEKVSKDSLRLTPGVTVLPVKDGVVVIFKSPYGEARMFFRKSSLAQPQSSVPVTPPSAPPPPKLTTDECLVKSGFQLGTVSKAAVKFSDDCAVVGVSSFSPKFSISALMLNGWGDSCSGASSTTVNVLIESQSIDLAATLRTLNPTFSNIDVLDDSAEFYYNVKVGGSTMEVPALSGQISTGDPNRKGFAVSGSVSAMLTLDKDATCRLLPNILAWKKNPQSLLNLLVNEFSIR